MKELLDLINRFQNLKEITGTNKTSSYAVSIHFDPWNDSVTVEFGGYDVPGWSRHEYLHTTRQDLLQDFEDRVREAEYLVNQDQGETK